MNRSSGRFWGTWGLSLGVVAGITVAALLAVWLLPTQYNSQIESSALALAALMMGWSAWQSRSLAYSAREEMEAESVLRRPYLNFDNWHLPDPTNQKLWRVNLKNFGTTPAYAVQVDMKPRISGYEGALSFLLTGASGGLIMPSQWNQWTIDLGSAPEIASSQQARLEVEFIIRYRSAARKPFKTWELKLARSPSPSISNWLLVGEDSETELVTKA
jgi:hypothetical protein